jgi:hypothetical protein
MSSRPPHPYAAIAETPEPTLVVIERPFHTAFNAGVGFVAAFWFITLGAAFMGVFLAMFLGWFFQ